MRKYTAMLLVLMVLLSLAVPALAAPQKPVITGTSKEVFAHYGLDAAGIAKAAEELL